MVILSHSEGSDSNTVRLRLWERFYRDFGAAGNRGETAPTNKTVR